MWRTGLASSSCSNTKKRPLAIHHLCIHLTFYSGHIKNRRLATDYFPCQSASGCVSKRCSYPISEKLPTPITTKSYGIMIFFKKKTNSTTKHKNKQYYYNKNLHISSIITLIFHLFFWLFGFVIQRQATGSWRISPTQRRNHLLPHQRGRGWWQENEVVVAFLKLMKLEFTKLTASFIQTGWKGGACC